MHPLILSDPLPHPSQFVSFIAQYFILFVPLVLNIYATSFSSKHHISFSVFSEDCLKSTVETMDIISGGDWGEGFNIPFFSIIYFLEKFCSTLIQHLAQG